MNSKNILWTFFGVASFCALILIFSMLFFHPKADENENVAEANLENTILVGPRNNSNLIPEIKDYEGETEAENFVVGEKEEGYTDKQDIVNNIDNVEVEKNQTDIESSDNIENKTAKEETKSEALPQKSDNIASRQNTRTERTTSVVPAQKSPEYWIQLGSYQSKSRAEQVKQNLAEKDFICRITSKIVDGDNYFRVRMGPYLNEAEANKFLNWVKNIEAYQGSYISQVLAN